METVEGLWKDARRALKRHDYQGSIRLSTMALARDPKNERFLTLRALALTRQNDCERGLQDLQMVIRKYPTHPQAYIQASDIFNQIGKSNLALQSLEIALKKVPSTDPLYATIESKLMSLGGDPILLSTKDSRALKKSRRLENSEVESPMRIRRENFGAHYLPVELIISILQLVPLKKRAQLMQLSQFWRALIRSSSILWTVIDLAPYSKRIQNDTLSSLVSYSKDGLVTLCLSNCSNITTLKPLITHRCRALKVLDLSFTKLKNYSLLIDTLKCMGRNLDSLNLSGTRVDNDCIRRILDICRRLQTLSLTDCSSLTDTAFEICDKFVAANIPLTLKALDVSNITTLTDKTVALVVKASPLLGSLDLSQNKKITTRSLVYLSQHSNKPLQTLKLNGTSLSCSPSLRFESVFMTFVSKTPNFKCLELTNVPYLTDLCLETLGALCPNLESINIRGSANVTSHGISCLALCPLKSVNVSTCPRLTNEGVCQLLAISTLETADLSSLGQLTDYLFDSLDGHGVNLSSLIIRNNPNITSQAILKLTNKAGCPLLELNVDNCPRISRDSLGVLKKRFNCCKISSLMT